MALAATAIGWVFIAAALAGAFYALAAAFVAGRFFGRISPSAREFPPVTVLKPLHGAEAALRENLESFCTQDYPAPLQIVLGVAGNDDTAIPIAEELRRAHPHLDIALSVGARREASNPKIGNLLGMLPSAKYAVLVLSDSDIGVPPDYLRKVGGALEAPQVGAVTCCYTGRALDNPWSRLSAMGIDYHFLPNVVLGVTAGLARPCFGSTIALRRQVLAEIGGFETFRDRLADDYEIGNAVRALGYRVALPPFTVAHTCTETSAAALFRHELRWARTILTVGRGGYAGSAVTHAFPLGLIGAVLLQFSPAGLAALGAALAARLYLKLKMDRLLARRGASLWLLPVRDVLSFAVFVVSFFPGGVHWRGSRYRVDEGGQLARE